MKLFDRGLLLDLGICPRLVTKDTGIENLFLEDSRDLMIKRFFGLI